MEVLAWQTVFLIPLPNNIILLPNPEKNMADYVFSHTTETQYLSITSLAENCKVSEATITRFCRGLGLSGYNAFKLALARQTVPPILVIPVIPLNPYLLKILFLLYVRKCTQPIFFL